VIRNWLEIKTCVAEGKIWEWSIRGRKLFIYRLHQISEEVEIRKLFRKGSYWNMAVATPSFF
jgi:hypothetical protein